VCVYLTNLYKHFIWLFYEIRKIKLPPKLPPNEAGH
jgi:hypothetical protein